jgi:adenosylhomocysteine nucleosidase
MISDPFFISGHKVYVIISGVGEKNMRSLLKRFPADQQIDYWVSYGLAGGLKEELAVGECFFGTTVNSGEGASYHFAVPSVLLADFSNYVLLSRQSIADTPDVKKMLFLQTGGALVDMEAAAVARHAQERGEGFFWLKVVSDSAEETLPPEMASCLGSNGFPSLLKALQVLLKKPHLIYTLIRFQQRTKVLSIRLAEKLHALLLQWAESS